MRQSLVEGLFLTLAGAVLGVLVGYGALEALIAAVPATLSRLEFSRIEGAVLAFTLAVAILWGIVFSLAPTAELLRSDPGRILTGGTGRSTAAPVRYRARATLVTVQIGLSLVLLVGAGLLARTFSEILRIDPGFQSEGRLTFRVALPPTRYFTPEATAVAMTELQHRIGAIPGVTHVGAISHLPYDDLPNWGLTYALEGPKTPGGGPIANSRAITPGLLETLGVLLVEGRDFTAHDRAPIVIIDDLLAARLWPGRSAVGQHFLIGQGEANRRVSVVGVVRSLKLRSVIGDGIPQIYVPYRVWQRTPMALVIHAQSPSAGLTADLRRVVAAFDPRLPIFDVRPLDDYVESARSIRRFTMWLAAAFAATAMLLTCIGVYGVLAYAVATRRHEFGVRRALGADTRRVVREVLGEGARFAIVGCIGGVAGAIAAAHLLRSQLYAVEPRDPATYAVAAGAILAGAILACVIPARRAAAISPMDSLRAE